MKTWALVLAGILIVAVVVIIIVVPTVLLLGQSSSSTSSSIASSSTSANATAMLTVEHVQTVGGNKKTSYHRLISVEPKYKKQSRFRRAALIDTTTPTYVGIKFISAFLAADWDPDANSWVNPTSLIYLNPQCNGNISTCDVGSSGTDVITTFFEFSAPTADVNAELSSQQNPVTSSTYKYVGLEFCKILNPTDAPNVSFQAGDMTEPFQFANSGCVVRVLADPPLVVESGSSVTITLSYDLTDTVDVYDTNPGDDNCSDTTPSYCFNLPQFIPSATVN